MVTNITSNSADLSWTPGGGETSWNLEIVEAGTTPGAGFGTAANPFSATGLTPQTDYEFYVKANCGSPNLLISGAFDGPLSGGLPKGVELYVVNDISNLSQYGLGSANNGGGTDGQEFTFPADAVTAGSFIYVTTDSAGFNEFFGFDADYITGAMSINGDDAVELFEGGVVLDVFGDINMDGEIDFFDIQPFIDVLSAGGDQAEADANCDGTVDFFDIQPFIDILAGGTGLAGLALGATGLRRRRKALSDSAVSGQESD